MKERCQIMGIVNVTPDSFWQGSRCIVPGNNIFDSVKKRILSAISEGSHIIDIGACSTRPGAEPCSEQEEWERLHIAIEILQNMDLDGIELSFDTFRASIASRILEYFPNAIINDVSGGGRDMYSLLSRYPQCRYVLTFAEDVTAGSEAGSLDSLYSFFDTSIEEISKVTGTDSAERIILDPGFGFGKTIKQNHYIFNSLANIVKRYNQYKILVGISRKSMIYKPLGITPEQSLPQTLVMNRQAIQAGASIIRVHDIEEHKLLFLDL